MVAIIGIPVYFWLFSEKSDQDEITKAKEQPLQLSNPNLVEYSGNDQNWQFLAEKGDIFENTQTAQFEKINLKIYKESNPDKKTEITAKFGKMNEKSGHLLLWGNVRINLYDGQEINTEELELDKKNRVVFNHKTVIVKSGRDTIEAKSFRYDIDSEKLVLNQPLINLYL